MTGTIKTIHPDKGFGFIIGEDRREYFFHRSSLKNVSFEQLVKGQDVSFEECESDKGPRAEDIRV